jgi:hypothetical protein
MFNKNDPLVDSVKKIMEQNEAHRQVEQKLCEELGIVSRKQLPHEHQANYDALLEERLKESDDWFFGKDKKPKDNDPERAVNRRGSGYTYRHKTSGKEISKASKGKPSSEWKRLKEEELKGDQHKIDANKNNKIDAQDFKLLRSKKVNEEEQIDEADDSKIQILNKKGFLSALKKGKAKQDKEKEAYSKMRQQMVGKGTDRETTRKLVGEEMQDSKNPVPSSALERIRNKLGTGPKSTFSGSRPAGEGPSEADREALKSKLNEISKERVVDYIKKAKADQLHLAGTRGSHGAKKTERYQKSEKGISTGLDKLTGKARVSAKEEVELEEAAKSKSQQRIMGMALAMRRGESDRGNREVARIATDMPEKELKKYAKTKHKDLPEKKK